MKKIIILVDQLHSHGGIEKLVAIKANYWATIWNYDVTILSTEQENKPLIYEFSNKINIIDLEINYNRKKRYFNLENIKKLSKNIFQVQKSITEIEPDFVLVASHIPITYIAPFLKTKAKTIKEFHFSKFRFNNNNYKNKIANYIESKYDFLVVLSNEEKKYYLSNNVVVIPNPVEREQIINNIPLAKRENNAVAILRFAQVKRIEKMVEIWSEFCKTEKSWKLYIFGETGNDYYNSIFELVKNKKMSDFIIFKGQANNVYNELSKAKLTLITSEQECFPMIILESFGCGVPVISFDCPTGPRNIISNGIDGVLVENNNINQFVNCLKQVVNDPIQLEKMSKKAVFKATNYTLSKIMNQWNDEIFMK